MARVNQINIVRTPTHDEGEAAVTHGGGGGKLSQSQSRRTAHQLTGLQSYTVQRGDIMMPFVDWALLARVVRISQGLVPDTGGGSTDITHATHSHLKCSDQTQTDCGSDEL